MSSALMMLSVVLGVLLASSSSLGKTTVKRGIPDFGFSSFSGGWNQQDQGFGFQGLLTPQPLPVFVKPQPIIPSGLSIQKHLTPYHPPISPAEIASAVAAAKEASSRVMYLQGRVQAAKEQLVEQQQAATAKEAAASAAAQRSEAAAAVARAASSAAASSVVRAQQKLAEAKNEVAEQQRIAAAKEALAAHVIQKSASAAAAEIQRTEDTAAKFAAFQRSESDAAIHHVTATKDAALAATGAAVSANAAASVHSAPSGHGGGNGGQYPPSGGNYHHWH